MKEDLSIATPSVWRVTPLGRALLVLAQALALVGGLVLLMMIAISTISVLGRKLFASPIQGDFELVQMGCAICVACFLPYCQAQRGHVIVDFFTLKLAVNTRRLLDAIAAHILAACAGVVSWRLYVGMHSVREANESSMLLGVPIWWAYAPMVVAFALLCVVALYSAWSEFTLRRHA